MSLIIYRYKMYIANIKILNITITTTTIMLVINNNNDDINTNNIIITRTKKQETRKLRRLSDVLTR